MQQTTKRHGWFLFRLIIPVFPEVNIFTGLAKSTTALGPILVATAANKLWGWRVEVIDENNYNGPRDRLGLPDHRILQKENPVTVVGFYCGLTSTIERVWELAELYRKQGVTTIAGGWHAHYCPEETLSKNIDIVAHGDGENVIRQILSAFKEEESFEAIPGISFLKNGEIITNRPALLEIPDLDDLPFPDFGLLRHSNKMKVFPIGRIRGCRMKCEFCSVKGEPRWASGRYLFDVVDSLVKTRKARKFFIVDDRLEENIAGTIEFFRMISEKYGRRLRFIVQVRLESAKNTELLEIMREAGVKTVCIGYESPINEELKAMHKGYLSSHMLEWTKIWRNYFRIHAMFMFGYPLKEKSGINAKEMTNLFEKFIRQGHFDTIQVLHLVPIVGTDLRLRLEKEGRIFSRELVPWKMYDGNYVCFFPDNMTLREFQEIPMSLMSRYYDPLSCLRIPLRILAFPVDYFIRGWEDWHRGWYKDIIKYGGYLLIQKWKKRQQGDEFIRRLEEE